MNPAEYTSIIAPNVKDYVLMSCNKLAVCSVRHRTRGSLKPRKVIDDTYGSLFLLPSAHARPYTAAISACETSKDQWQTALKRLAEMQVQGIQPDVITYTAAIRACRRSKDQWQTTWKLLAEMQLRDIQPNVITYNAAISARERSKDQWQTALKLLAAIQVHVIQPM